MLCAFFPHWHRKEQCHLLRIALLLRGTSGHGRDGDGLFGVDRTGEADHTQRWEGIEGVHHPPLTPGLTPLRRNHTWFDPHRRRGVLQQFLHRAYEPTTAFVL